MLSYHGTAFFARGFWKKSDFFREIPENLHAGKKTAPPVCTAADSRAVFHFKKGDYSAE
jgi:hypothetical protein